MWAVFGSESDIFGRADQQWMINFRVSDLDAMISQLRAAGLAVEVDSEEYPNGRFARLTDPTATRFSSGSRADGSSASRRRAQNGVLGRGAPPS